ncbi:MAG: acyltransferase [Hyphomonas sp.]|uniref:acyltransferase family protein n=1 Tax=Hyphomonas sp. TaxID=87 RepID=UPI003529D2B1
MTTPSEAVAASRVVFGSLNGLRFFLAIWIAYFHVGHMFDEHGFGDLPLLRMGIARVDMFFVLSGFVLTHVYWARRTKPFDFPDFMAARIARIYPMYLIALALIGTYLILGIALGKSPEASYPVSDLIKCLFFLQAFGLTETNAWNFPAWAVAAEMGGYVAFPVFIFAANRMRQHPWILLGIAIGIVAAVQAFLWNAFHMHMNLATTDWGALRGASVMFCGSAARVAYDAYKPGKAGTYAGLAAGIGIAVITALNQWGVPLIGLGAALMMMSLARLDADYGGTFLSRPLMQTLGNWSYVIFILHAPVYTILVHGMSLVGIDFVANAWTSLGMTAIVVAISGPIFNLIERPARARIRQAWENFRGHRIAKAGL